MKLFKPDKRLVLSAGASELYVLAPSAIYLYFKCSFSAQLNVGLHSIYGWLQVMNGAERIMRAQHSVCRRVIPIAFAPLLPGTLVLYLDRVAHVLQVAEGVTAIR
jgi:hypothetical protein